MSEKPEKRTESRVRVSRVFGSAPWLKSSERKDYRVKIFQSGNSVALRLPAELGLQPGTEMNLRVENGEFYSFEAVERPVRKFNVGKVWGIAPELELIKPEDRVFDPSERLRGDTDK